MRLTTAAIVVSATLSLAHAQTERELDSHEHGHATLNIAFDGSNAFVELESPWNNLVGFEHAPSTDEQHALVDEALALLNQPNDVFAFKGAECVMTDVMLENSLGEHDDEHSDHDHDGEKHDDDDHGEKHDDDHDEKHDDDHDEKHDDDCLLYTSPSPRDGLLSRMPSSA